MCIYIPYQFYAYGYHIPPIFKEKMPLRASAIVVNSHQHHYHSSDTEKTCICQFFLTSHSITSMGHARLFEILYKCCKLYFLVGIPQTLSFLEPVQGVVNSKSSTQVSLSLYARYRKETIMYLNYIVLPRPHTLGGNYYHWKIIQEK